MRNVVLAALLLALASELSAQEEKAEEKEKAPPAAAEEKPPVVTEHQLRLNGNVLPCKVTTGRMPIRIEEYEAGHMMYIHGGSLAKMKSDITSFFQETKSMSGRGVGNVPGGR
jgi:carboxypeptidase C (cathepsin A)